jgi:hypothetical protein
MTRVINSAHIDREDSLSCDIHHLPLESGNPGFYVMTIQTSPRELDRHFERAFTLTMYFQNEESLRQAMYAFRQAIDAFECELDGLDYMDYEREPF